MAEISQSHKAVPSLSLTDRRKAPRIPMPIAVEIEFAAMTYPAIVRDLALGTVEHPSVSGVAILHHDPLPVNEVLICRTLAECESLPAVTELTLKWSRHFNNEAFLSGGELHCLDE